MKERQTTMDDRRSASVPREKREGWGSGGVQDTGGGRREEGWRTLFRQDTNNDELVEHGDQRRLCAWQTIDDEGLLGRREEGTT